MSSCPMSITLRTPSLALLMLASLACTAAQAVPWTLQVRNSAGQPLADAVVAVELRGQATKADGVKAEMAQRNRQFQPQLLIVQTGTAVNFPNFDTVRHHVYSFSPIKVIDIKLYSGTPSEPIVFDKPGVAALGRNIHDRMSATSSSSIPRCSPKPMPPAWPNSTYRPGNTSSRPGTAAAKRRPCKDKRCRSELSAGKLPSR
ncbi:methylamine utilization protein [Roseateles sp. GG27B]